MPYKNPETRVAKNKGFSKSHYDKNKPEYLERNRAKRKKIQEFIRKSKYGKPCMDCHGFFPSFVMDYDHREPDKKTINLANACAKMLSLDKIKTEIGKCDLVCANCHRIRTHAQRSIPASSKGRTSDFDSENRGSNP